MVPERTKIALLYDDSGYVEILQPIANAGPDRAAGLMGRQVAGKEFLDAYLSHGDWVETTALVYNQASANSIVNWFKQHPLSQAKKRKLQIVGVGSFLQHFVPVAPANVLYTPCPPEPFFAWPRQHRGPGAYALCGITHTLSSMRMAHLLCEMVTAPFEPYDVLICTSRSVVKIVRSITGVYSDYLRERHGGQPALRPRLEIIPLGVDTGKFHPPTAEQRAAQRKALRAADDEVIVLFVGRFAAHAKAHPYPIFHALAQAAKTTGKKVHLVLAGWPMEGAPPQSFSDGCRAFAPNVRLTLIDGTKPQNRFSVWHAADIFTSLVDNIQETFGLVIIEAMAAGLPVVATDWDGYRDLVVEGETGYLVPTYMVDGATGDTTMKLLMDAVNYDQFLSECNQAVTVDLGRSAECFAQLINDAALRRRLGEAGRQRALERFAWPKVIKSYEDLWRSQETELLAHRSQANHPRKTYLGPARYPSPETSYAGHPTCILRDDQRLRAVAGTQELLPRLLQLPLTNYAEYCRTNDQSHLRAVLAAAAQPCAIADLDQVLGKVGVGQVVGRATIAWMLKYGLLEYCAPESKEREAPQA